jgi:hypothetical protein
MEGVVAVAQNAVSCDPGVPLSRVGVIRPPGVGVFRPVGGVPKSVLEALFEGPILQC